MEWYLKVWRDWLDFKGRATRTEYWMFTLFNVVIMALISFIGYFIDTDLIDLLYSLAVIIPAFAVSIRRLHDTNRSAWWLLIMLVPVIGFIVLLVFYCQDSREDNQYGRNPKSPRMEQPDF
ncbi:DUF805 domain-containing protein [Seleniivibrio sp.]|uniref:DUF805 domain-containing protein n=1 Tax=Seleniivibrio sp. TaxID=2898801 RepID=UPI0025FBDB9B|nr:DUF805 domain-containing protein [Seleniivibrio sp.]MCD8552385.1 DUF805 domain-containing protein [Seleniivibrio sp.]